MSFLQEELQKIVQSLYGVELNVELTRPDHAFGDYSTNVALRLGKQLSLNPREIAEAIVEKLNNIPEIKSSSVAGPGFINIVISDKLISDLLSSIKLPKRYSGKTIVAEYSDPNPFKVLHAGHLYTSLVGDAIANILEVSGGTVHRVNFGGDVGLHVAKTMWAIIKSLGGENPAGLETTADSDKLDWLSERYMEGNTAYEYDPEAKVAIQELNKRIYQLHQQNDKTSSFAQIYWTCRGWSYSGFDKLYEQLGMHPFEKYYPESLTTPAGLKTIDQGLKNGVFEESEGAVVYRGEKDGLHTRVFRTSAGLPTYEAKDLGLAVCKWEDYHFDLSFMSTANDITEYMKVVLAVLTHFNPEIAKRTKHLTHGLIKLAGGNKMSSRKGNILRARDVLLATAMANKKQTGKEDESAVLGAVKYAFLKQRIGGDIIYDPLDSVSIIGNSGPYLQYAHARAKAIIRKTQQENSTSPKFPMTFEEGERTLALKITDWPDAFALAVDELAPHHLCTYLYELAQVFNRFYENNRVIDDPRQDLRLSLVNTYLSVLKEGLNILGINALEEM